MASRRKRMARAAARRLPLAGTAVALAPALRAWVAAGLDANTIGRPDNWRIFANELIKKYTGVDPASGAVQANELLATYLPVAAYVGVRKLGLSKPISRALGKLGMRF